MIVGDELLAWAHDRACQRDTQRAVNAFGADWPKRAVHQHFAAAIGCLRDPGLAEIVDTVRRLIESDAWVDVLVAALAQPLRDDPFFLLPFQSLSSELHSGLLVYEDDHVQIAASVGHAAQLAAKKAGSSGGSINFSGQINVLRFLRAGGAWLSFWEAPPITENFSASNAGLCRHVASRRIADGETIVVDGRSQSYIVDHASANFLLLQAAIKTGQAPLGVEYDAATGRYLGCSATGDADSRIQMMTTLLRKLGGGEAAFRAVADLLDHPRFFVRWHAMRELLGIDPSAALPRLKTMAARDPHPDVRAAAVATLTRIEVAAAAAREAA